MKKRAILIAGPTASGKSSLALRLAQRIDGIVVNADALQVYDRWRVLTARPSDEELAQAPHALYGHVPYAEPYSVGDWIKETSLLIDKSKYIPIIVGGTGLYFSALLNGLSEIPSIPAEIRQYGDTKRLSHGADWFRDQLQQNDPESLAKLDQNNPARLQRAWEVLEATGKGMSYWHKRPTRPIIPHEETHSITLNWLPEQLNIRIDSRFDIMVDTGAIEECEMAKTSGYDPTLPSNRAIGAREIIDALNGKITMQEAAIKAKILTHQFAKRQRTWFRSKMNNWHQLNLPDEDALDRAVEKCVAEFT